jgi:predicted MPP superfamily phosphohydrolase
LRTRRRQVLAAITLVVIVLGVKAFWLEPASLTVVDDSISIQASLTQPLRIAVLTDLHVGSPFNGIDNLRKVVDLTNASQPDIICILGDFVIQGVRGGTFVAPEAIAAELKRLQPAGHVYGVLGNHDGWLDHDRIAAALRENGVRIVEDTAVRIETKAGPLWIAGISDLWTGKHDLEAALGSIANNVEPAILLTHSPDIFPDVPARISLTLAGHTHGGQVRFPLIGAPVIPSKFGTRFAAGHIVEGGRHLFVATGIGTSILPVRFRVPPAISLLTIHGSH